MDLKIRLILKFIENNIKFFYFLFASLFLNLLNNIKKNLYRLIKIKNN